MFLQPCRRVRGDLKMGEKICTLNLLVKIFWREEEVVEWHKVSLQQTHQQHQINTICKLTHSTGRLTEQMSGRRQCRRINDTKNNPTRPPKKVTSQSCPIPIEVVQKCFTSIPSQADTYILFVCVYECHTCVSNSETSKLSLFRCLFTNVISV